MGDLPVTGPILVPQELPSLLAAVVAAEPGDTILLAPGTYTSDVLLDKPLVIASQGGGEVVIRANVSTTIQIVAGASGTVLRDLTIEGLERTVTIGDDNSPTSNITLDNVVLRVTKGAQGGIGLLAEFCSGLVVRNCRLETDDVGIQLGARGACPDALLEGVTVQLTDAGAQGGFVLARTPGLRAVSLTVGAPQSLAGVAIGFQLDGASGVTLENSQFTLPGEQTIGIRMLRAPASTVTNCQVRVGAEGITLGTLLAETGRVAQGVIEGCRIELTAMTNLAGILVVGVDGATVRGNRVDGAASGVRCERFNGFLVAENEIHQCGVGLRFDNSEEDTGADQRVLRNVVASCAQAVDFAGTSVNGVLVANNLFINQVLALSTEDVFLLVLNNVITTSQTAVLNSGGQVLNLQNNIIASSSGATLLGAVVGDYNNFYLNADGQPPLGPNGITSVNLVQNDLTPSPGSPLIDGGNPDPSFNDNIPPGLGSARNDIGLTGGPFSGDVPLELIQSLLNPRVLTL